MRLFSSSPRWGFSKATDWGLKVFTQEGSEEVPPFTATRLLAAVWLLASLVFMSSYGGILTAMLTVPRVTIPIDSLADLVAQDELPWTVEKSSMMYQYFQVTEAEDGARKKFFDDLLTTIQDCYSARQDIASSQYAAICDRTTMKKAMSWDYSTTGKCHLYISREDVFTNIQIAMAFQINSTYLRRTNTLSVRSFIELRCQLWINKNHCGSVSSCRIHVLKEAGILDLWLAQEITNASQCLRPPSADRSTGIAALTIDALAGSFLLLGGGLAASIAIFLLEVALKRR
ncbi:hypothetical protein O3P69_000275 [Scylla paramamosain]|uniref:Ionotropic glutamate receptor C-terminal domain-containing protein n=1 Tax=Scylla paramamosain TaxID=85552 RepID=A0AAW0V0G5_SCYPA